MDSVDVNGTGLPLDGAKFPNLAMQTGSVSQSEFKIGALEPTWIIEGSPVVRALALTNSEDGLFSCGLWDCTAGKFKFIFGYDEIVHIIEGEVTIQQTDAEYTLRPGDVAFFPKGATTYWTVPHYVKKFCIHRSVQRSLAGKIHARIRQVLKR